MTCLVIDGGGSGSRGALVSPAGVQSRSQGGPCQALEHHLPETVSEILKQARLLGAERPPKYAIAAIAGAAHRTMAAQLEAELRRQSAWPWRVLGDAQWSLAGVVQHERGLLLIAGTGSVALGLHHQKLAQAGGWGPLLGDSGSGYRLGLLAMRHLTAVLDGLVPVSRLFAELGDISERLAQRDFRRLAEDGILAPRAVAALAPRILAAAQQGDGPSIALVDEAAQDLAVTGVAVARRLDLLDEARLPIGLAGGLFRSPFYQARVRQALQALGLNGLVSCSDEFWLEAARRACTDPDSWARRLVSGQNQGPSGI